LDPDQKRELLARLLKAREVEHLKKQLERSGDRSIPDDEPPLQRIARDRDLQLSFGQERVWFLEQLQPENVFYNVLDLFTFHGQLNVELLRRSIEAVVNRHEVLRTTYPSIEGQPFQKIGPPVTWVLRVVDLREDFAPVDRETEARRQIAADAKTPFDLGTGPLLRTTLYKLDDQDYIFALIVHHIAIDGWSVKLLMRELALHYTAAIEGRSPSLPDLPVQYADFAVWQRQWLSGKRYAAERDYWLGQLGARPPTLNLCSDFARPSRRTFAAGVHTAVIPATLLARLRELSRQEGVTLFTTLLTGFVVLLMRYTRQEDFVVGTLIAGRTRPELEPVLGFFANTLALRIDLSGDPSVKEAIARTRDVVIGAHSHETFPFEKIVEEIRPERGLSNNPLTNVFFNMLNFWKRDEIVLPGIRVLPIGGLDLHSVADGLTLFASESGDQLDLRYSYSSEQFKPDTIERLAGHFLALLEAAVANPEASIWSLPILSKNERRGIEAISSGSTKSFTADVSLSRLFEDQARARPDSIAVTFGGQNLSYATLNERANRVARRLQSFGVEPGSIVALCTERSLELVVGILGILKAGAAYLPLDPRDPKERLEFMLADTAASVLLTHKVVGTTSEFLGVETLLFEDVLAEPPVGTDFQVVEPSPDSLAYVIYTSGSTGQPKGVLITHANVVRLLRSTESLFQFGPGDVWTLFHSFAFDFSVWELWGALAYGGRLVVVPFLTSRDPAQFLDLIIREKVTVLNQTPSAFRQLIEAERASSKSTTLRFVIFGGEALELQSLRGWIADHGDQRPLLVNMYGITETCVHVTWKIIKQSDVEANIGSIIGLPIPDLHIYLLDSHNQLVPFGVPGEIYVGGPGLAKGYLNRPELTGQRFLPDPFQPGQRLYRSGDLARRMPDGQLEYIGRIDQQVKIRGFRVELGEIEAAISEHAAVSEAVVVVRTLAGSDRLVGYVVLQNDKPAGEQEIRDLLRRKLPPHMIPHSIEILTTLPLTRNGKVDRQALPEPAQSTPSSIDHRRTSTEEKVARVWQEVLGKEQIGPHDNFFEIGGQSLLAVRVAARLRETFDVDLPVSRIFEFQALGDLAAHIDGLKINSAAARHEREGIPTLTRVSRESVLRVTDPSLQSGGAS
jgi:amino acid adenylation domain-containing protein